MTYPRLDIEVALATGDGSWMLVLGGAVLVFSFVGLAWVQASSDIARYQRPASSGAASMLWATVGATLPPFVLIAWGAMLAASDPNLATGLASSPLPTIARLLPLWYPAPLLAAAGIGLLSGIVLTIYSGGFALQALGLADAALRRRDRLRGAGGRDRRRAWSSSRRTPTASCATSPRRSPCPWRHGRASSRRR